MRHGLPSGFVSVRQCYYGIFWNGSMVLGSKTSIRLPDYQLAQEGVPLRAYLVPACGGSATCYGIFTESECM